jgi:hypothetical protein
MPRLESLRKALGDTPSGLIKDKAVVDHILSVLVECWPQITGSHATRMRAYKLERVEDLWWTPPLLSFTIERHGATALGFSRAELQEWTVDLDTGIANHLSGRRRQIRPMAPRLDVNRIVARVCQIVEQGQGPHADVMENESVFWNSNDEVLIKHTLLISGEGFKQTVVGRRCRFRKELTSKMEALGWRLASKGRFLKFQKVTIPQFLSWP